MTEQEKIKMLCDHIETLNLRANRFCDNHCADKKPIITGMFADALQDVKKIQEQKD